MRVLLESRVHGMWSAGPSVLDPCLADCQMQFRSLGFQLTSFFKLTDHSAAVYHQPRHRQSCVLEPYANFVMFKPY